MDIAVLNQLWCPMGSTFRGGVHLGRAMRDHETDMKMDATSEGEAHLLHNSFRIAIIISYAERASN